VTQVGDRWTALDRPREQATIGFTLEVGRRGDRARAHGVGALLVSDAGDVGLRSSAEEDGAGERDDRENRRDGTCRGRFRPPQTTGGPRRDTTHRRLAASFLASH
jgi:hypothetical protein